MQDGSVGRMGSQIGSSLASCNRSLFELKVSQRMEYASSNESFQEKPLPLEAKLYGNL